jgi:aquaporin Z
VPGYWAAQFGGAVVAAALLGALFGDVAHLGASRPRYGVVPALVMEVILTFFLVTVILGTATRYRLIGPSAALAVGATIALDGLFAAPVSGASMNPARSLGPALVAGALDHAWIYLAGPAGGAVLAVILAWLLHGAQHGGEQEAAKGKDQQ